MENIYLYFYMNGYGFYIWTAYSVWFVLISILLFKVISRKKNIEKKLRYIKSEK